MSLGEAIARSLADGPFLLSWQNVSALADALDDDDPGIRELAYRATLVVFPFVHQRVNYSLAATKDERKAAVDAFRAELKAIAKRRDIVIDSTRRTRYDWRE